MWSVVGGAAWFCALHLLGRRLVRPPPLPARVVEQQAALVSKAERWKQLDAERQARQAAARQAPAATSDRLLFNSFGGTITTFPRA